MLRGCVNLRPKKPRVRKPVTVEMLGKLLPDFDLSKAIDRSTWAVITTAVHGLCRLGELAPETHAGEFYPRRKDYSLSAEGRANIFIARSKTDVNHEGFHLPIPRNGTATCPHRALVEAVAAGAPGRLYSAPEDPLFPDSSNRAVLKYYVIKRLRRALTRAGYNAAEFSGHSLRKVQPWPRHAQHRVHGPLGDRLPVAPALPGDHGRRTGRMGHAVRGTYPGSRHTQL